MNCGSKYWGIEFYFQTFYFYKVFLDIKNKKKLLMNSIPAQCVYPNNKVFYPNCIEGLNGRIYF